MPTPLQNRIARPVLPPATVWRLVVFSALWWGLTEGDLQSWYVGVPVVIAATTASHFLRTAPRWRLHVLGTLAFAVIFFLESLRAGVDVAVRAVTLKLSPRIIIYHVTLHHPAARTFFAGIISLLPGTLTTAIDGDVFEVHTLDERRSNADGLRNLETRIAAMFGEAE